MPLRFTRIVLAAALLAFGAAPRDDGDDGSFGMSAPVACREIRGYEDYDPLASPALTADEKLLVYYRPRHFKTAGVDGRFEAHLTQDCRVRRRGEKAVLWSKANMVDYRPRADTPPRQIFIRNTVSLKGLKPGEYDLDLILHDKIGRSAPAVRTLPFRVIARGE
jgi:hypothetical protein